MKNLLLLLCLTSFITGYSQNETQNDFPKNEIKGNALFLVLGSLDFAYERILNEESGIGVSVNIPFDKEMWDLNYSFTGYYRYYFGRQPAKGFFGEAFGMLNNVDDYVYNYSSASSFDSYSGSKTLTDFALGIGVGGKWITRKGVLFEINGGVGRNLFNNQYDDRDYQLIGRFGISVGYRF